MDKLTTIAVDLGKRAFSVYWVNAETGEIGARTMTRAKLEEFICFTTGRGSAYGCAPSPSVKLATNTALWHKQSDDMDLNCGEVVDGTRTIEELGAVLFQLLPDTASGQRSRSEQHGYGQNEFVPWQIGAIT